MRAIYPVAGEVGAAAVSRYRQVRELGDREFT
jgi:hypothetical protein